MDRAVQDFLKNVANTLTKLEILSYLHDHPFALDNSEGVAGWINRESGEVAQDLDELAAAGVVTREGEGAEAVYSYSLDDSVRETVVRAVEAFRLTRDAVYGQVLEHQRQQHELRRQYQRLLLVERGRTDTILNSLEEAVVVTDREERLLLANERFLNLFCKQSEFRPGAALAGAVDDSRVAEAVRQCPESGELESDFHNGERLYRLRKNPVTGPDGKLIADELGRPVGTVTVFHDVTRDREIEKMREDFLSMLTHDLKNPLGVIFGSSTLVLDGKIGLLNEKQNRLLRNVVKSCGQMERLIDDFLSLSRLEAGQLKLNEAAVELDSLVAGV
ncbi:MAG TPA: histidine kinase dimerization/phospho-acceptor domain-containing protein, partial [Candidatus Glassbacteria bacterium]|nr:histidine kinase dimerization/phospho-acceptor domain-containing protein [Candidatus Glassbacteria bacterium]